MALWRRTRGFSRRGACKYSGPSLSETLKQAQEEAHTNPRSVNVLPSRQQNLLLTTQTNLAGTGQPEFQEAVGMKKMGEIKTHWTKKIDRRAGASLFFQAWKIPVPATTTNTRKTGPEAVPAPAQTKGEKAQKNELSNTKAKKKSKDLLSPWCLCAFSWLWFVVLSPTVVPKAQSGKIRIPICCILQAFSSSCDQTRCSALWPIMLLGMRTRTMLSHAGRCYRRHCLVASFAHFISIHLCVDPPEWCYCGVNRPCCLCRLLEIWESSLHTSFLVWFFFAWFVEVLHIVPKVRPQPHLSLQIHPSQAPGSLFLWRHVIMRAGEKLRSQDLTDIFETQSLPKIFNCSNFEDINNGCTKKTGFHLSSFRRDIYLVSTPSDFYWFIVDSKICLSQPFCPAHQSASRFCFREHRGRDLPSPGCWASVGFFLQGEGGPTNPPLPDQGGGSDPTW